MKGLGVEVIELRMKRTDYGNVVDEEHEKEIYEEEFKPRSKILSQRMDISIRDALRSRSGHYYIAGNIAITRDGLVEWYTTYSDRFKKYDDDHTIGFLRALLDKGLTLIQELCKEVEAARKTEASILERFIKSGVLKGKFEREVRVGRRIFEEEIEGRKAVFDWRKSIDAVCHSEGETWILEVKRPLNYEALGEVIVYSVLYKNTHPSEKVRLGIVCEEVDGEIAEACDNNGVSVFQITSQ